MMTKPMSRIRFKKADLLAGLLAVGLAAYVTFVGAPRSSRAVDVSAKTGEFGPFTGVWTGEYHYPDGSNARPVTFTAWIVQSGEKLTGEIREPNSFGAQEDPWLHATLEGRLDPKTRGLTFTKTYDGTGGVSHHILYKGHVSEDGKKVDDGTWKMPDNWDGTFTLKKKEQFAPKDKDSLARCIGVWKGEYRYGDPSAPNPVAFTLVLVPQGDGLAGEIKETRTFGREGAPWLHATVEARFDPEKRALSFIKTYDGTAQVEHDVRYEGQLAADGKKVEGTWKIGDADGAGTFTLNQEAVLTGFAAVLGEAKPDHADDAVGKADEFGPFTGAWTGEYQYPAGSGTRPVTFNVIVVQRGEKLTGEIREPNSFGQEGDPWLHATMVGKLERESRNLTFTKTYDGTGGVSHAVEYKGRLAAGSKRVEDGAWTIGGGDGGGTFTLKKKEHLEPKDKSGLARCVGVWKGEFRYPDGAGMEPVSFTLLLVPQGDNLAGEIKETRTFGREGAPWLHATVEARFDPEKQTLSLIKTYDGTAQVEHDVRYEGRLGSDGNKVEGTWKIGNDAEGGTGAFTLSRESGVK